MTTIFARDLEPGLYQAEDVPFIGGGSPDISTQWGDNFPRFNDFIIHKFSTVVKGV